MRVLYKLTKPTHFASRHLYIAHEQLLWRQAAVNSPVALAAHCRLVKLADECDATLVCGSTIGELVCGPCDAATRQQVADIQFACAKRFIEATMPKLEQITREHLESVLVYSAGQLADGRLVSCIQDTGPAGMSWRLSKTVVQRVRRRRRFFHAEYGREKHFLETDYAYARQVLSSPKMPHWSVNRRELGPKLTDAVAFTVFEDQEICFNDDHLSHKLYPSLFHFQTGCHEMAHAVMFAADHKESWANLARLLGDRTARAQDTIQSGNTIIRSSQLTCERL